MWRSACTTTQQPVSCLPRVFGASKLPATSPVLSRASTGWQRLPPARANWSGPPGCLARPRRSPPRTLRRSGPPSAIEIERYRAAISAGLPESLAGRLRDEGSVYSLENAVAYALAIGDAAAAQKQRRRGDSLSDTRARGRRPDRARCQQPCHCRGARDQRAYGRAARGQYLCQAELSAHAPRLPPLPWKRGLARHVH